MNSAKQLMRAAGEAEPGRAVGDAAASRPNLRRASRGRGRTRPAWLIRPAAAAPALIAAVMSFAQSPLPEPQVSRFPSRSAQARYDFAWGHPLRGIYCLVARSRGSNSPLDQVCTSRTRDQLA
jgi:hypothetical protein